MKGLLIKDLMLVKKHCMYIFIVGGFFFIVSLLSEQSMYFSYYSVAIISLTPTIVMAYDESYKWNRYAAVIPLSRTKCVLEKYILTLIFVTPIIIIETILMYLVKGVSGKEIFSLISLMLFCGLIEPTIVLPLNFKFGYMKSKIINILIIGTMSGAIAIINAKNSTGETMIEGNFTPSSDAFLFALIAIILMIISIMISIAFYKKREF